MPTNVRFRRRRMVDVVVPVIEVAFLADDTEAYEAAKASAAREDREGVLLWYLTDREVQQRERWEFARQRVAEYCANVAPGTRSSWWWRLEGRLRPRLGGVGSDWGAVCPNYNPEDRHSRGIPQCWVTAASLAFHQSYLDSRGAAVDLIAVDPNDPPALESQAAFLRRNGLLVRGEAKRLSGADFKPELVTVD
jgi:hypothetical protein